MLYPNSVEIQAKTHLTCPGNEHAPARFEQLLPMLVVSVTHMGVHICGKIAFPIHQAVSSVIASTLVAGGVAVFAGVEELPKVSLAVLAESMRAVLLCLHARQEKVLVNGEEVSRFQCRHQS